MALVGFFVLGIAARLVLLPTPGLRGDLDQFVGWVHHIATAGLGSLYEGTDAGPVTFGPVMAYVWSVLAAIQPAFVTVTDASDPAVRALMKAPASIADLGLAALVVFALRDRPRWALVGAVGVLLHPAVIDVSAWWGQYESIFVLSGLAATIAAVRGHDTLAAALLAVSLLTKPQAIAFAVPFAAWFWARGYGHENVRGAVRALSRAALVGAGVALVLWLPFLGAAGPLDYLRNLGVYQNEIFNVLSLRAWNPWWLLQEVAVGGGNFIADDIPIAGPITFRVIGYLVTAVVQIVIALAIVRDPRPKTLVLGLVTSILVIFSFMTQMHERYAYAAAIFLILLIADPRLRWLTVGVGIAVTLNLWWAIPPAPIFSAALPRNGILGILGPLLMLCLTVVAVSLTAARPAGRHEPARM